MPTRTKSKAPIKGRVWYVADTSAINILNYKKSEDLDTPIFILPLTAPDGTPVYEELVERAAKAMAQHSWSTHTTNRPYWRAEAKRALAAIGITAPKEGKK